MAKVPDAEEKLPNISTGWVGRTNVTDRQTTDGTATAYSEHEHKFKFAKKGGVEWVGRIVMFIRTLPVHFYCFEDLISVTLWLCSSVYD